MMEEEDLFGPTNSEYMKATPFSKLEPPRGRILASTFKLSAPGHDDSLRASCPQFQQPQPISHFSRTSDGQVHFDERGLRRFRPSVLNERGADLSIGYSTFVQKREGEEEENPFQDLLHTIRRSKYPLETVHFVTFRNNLNKILGTLYNRQDEWEMGVHKRGTTVYLDVHKLPEEPMKEPLKRFIYYGYSYERLATERRAPPPGSGGPPNSSTPIEPVDANEEYCALLKTKLGAHRILLGAEMDCYDRDQRGQRHFVELKTSREFTDQRGREQFDRKKLLKIWIQSFLAGVPKVVVGFRDDLGHVVRSEAMGLKDITERVKKKSYWEGGCCLAFGDRVLCWLYGSLLDDHDDCVLRFSRYSNRLELFRTGFCPPVIEKHCSLIS